MEYLNEYAILPDVQSVSERIKALLLISDAILTPTYQGETSKTINYMSISPKNRQRHRISPMN